MWTLNFYILPSNSKTLKNPVAKLNTSSDQSQPRGLQFGVGFFFVRLVGFGFYV